MKDHALWKILSLTLVLGLLLAGCPQGGEEQSETATLSGVTFQKDSARADFTELGTPGKTWDDAAIVEGAISIPDRLNGGAITVTQDDSGASVRFAQAAGGSAEPVFGTENVFSFTTNSYLWIEVTAPAGNQLIYKIKIVLQSENANLTSVTIAGVTATLGTPGGSDTDPALTAGEAVISASQQGALAITVVKGNSGATVSYATGASPGTYSATAPAAISGDETLWIKVVSEAETVQVYKIVIEVRNNSTAITGATFKGTALTVGTSGTQFLDTMNPETFETIPGAPSTDVTLASAADLQNATLSATAPAGGTVKAIFSSDGITVEEWGTASRTIQSAAYIGFEVSSELGDTVYYRWRVLAGSGVAKLNSLTINSAPTVNHLADAAWQTLLAEYNGAANANNDAPGAAAVEGQYLIGWPAFGYGFNMTTFTAIPRAPLSYVYNAASLATVNVAGAAAENGTILYALSANADGFNVVQGALPESILQPAGGQASGNFTSVPSGTFIWIQVTSQNRANVMYYRLRVTSGNNNAALQSASISFGATAVPLTLPASTADINAALTAAYAAAPVDLTQAQAEDTAAILAGVLDGASTGAVIKYAIGYYTYYEGFGGFGGIFGGWSAAGSGDLFAAKEAVEYVPAKPAGSGHGNYLCFEVTSQSGATVKYYAVRINVPQAP
jgi:hypothetical protein